ncbi:MAG: D-2-hydroxyacid dehydrogenase [Lachnospiraceae bacterium]|nr:D-2-hydroxyacid dehydrogenase [Lachnospiraceae bacterium]
MKIICNSLYRHLIKEEYYPDILFLSNEECDRQGDGYDLSEVEAAVLQPFYVNKAFLDRMPKLKYVQITGAGYDRVDVEEVKKRGLIMSNTRGVMSVSIAEDVFTKLLFFTRQVRRVEQDKKEHVWDMFGQDQWMCSCYEDLYGKTLGIMGYGSIGSEIAKRAAAFGMKIHVYDVFEQKDGSITKCFIGPDSLKDFYPSCDYLVVCIPLNEKTRHMLGEEAFERMKDSAILINIARGPLVDTDALIKALKEKKIRAAALDVFEQEPLPSDSPLWNTENLYMSSHKAGMGDSWKGFIGDLIMRNIDNYRLGKEPENVIRL